MPVSVPVCLIGFAWLRRQPGVVQAYHVAGTSLPAILPAPPTMCVPVETTSNQDLISGAAFSFVSASAASGGAAGSSS
eukprot:5188505-Prymnesium_polylepis.1